MRKFIRIFLLLALSVALLSADFCIFANEDESEPIAPQITVGYDEVVGDEFTCYTDWQVSFSLLGYDEKEVSWTSSDSDVILVDEWSSGDFQYVDFYTHEVGTAVLTATVTESGISDTVTVNVIEPPLLTLEETENTILEYTCTNDIYTFIPETDGEYGFYLNAEDFNVRVIVAEYVDGENYSFYWSDCKQNHSFMLQLTADTTYRILILSENEGDTGDYSLLISEKLPAEKIIVNDGYSISGKVGDSRTLKYALSPDSCMEETVSWSSSNSTVVSVDNDGKITFLSPGNAYVTATGDFSGAVGSVYITVTEYPKAESITIESGDIKGNVGDEYTLNYSLSPDGCAEETIAWSSSDESIVTVDSNGKIYLSQKGTAQITATTENGLSDTITVTVGETVYFTNEETVIGTLQNTEASDVFKFVPQYSGYYLIYQSSDDKVRWDCDWTIFSEGNIELTSENAVALADESVDIGSTPLEPDEEVINLPVHTLYLTAGEEYDYSISHYNNEKTDISYSLIIKYRPMVMSVEIYELSDNNIFRPVDDTITIYIGSGNFLCASVTYNVDFNLDIAEGVSFSSSNKDVVIVKSVEDSGEYLSPVGEGSAIITAKGGLGGVYDVIAVTVKSADKRLYGGDIDGDGSVTVLDMASLKKVLLDVLSENTQCDANGDGCVNICDLIRFKKYFADLNQ